MGFTGVVMAGGEGTRLRPLTERFPKPFVRIAGKPTIAYILERLVEAGAGQVILTTFYRPDQLLQGLGGGDRFGVPLFYSYEDTAMGTAGGVAKCRGLLNETFVVASGDVLADVDIASLVAEHKKSGADATIALTEVENPAEFGIVGVDRTGRIDRFKEKPKTPEETFSNLINAGIYVIEPHVLDLVPKEGAFDFSKQLWPKLLAEGMHIHGARLTGLWMDVGRPSDLLRAHASVGDRKGKRHQDRALVHPAGKVVASDLYPESVVGPRARVENSILYDGARVEDGAVVLNSILDDNAVVGPRAVVVDSVLGANARVKPDVRLTGARVPVDATVSETPP